MNPTQKKLLGELVHLRHAARGWIRVNQLTRENITRFEANQVLGKALGDDKLEASSATSLQECRERLIQYRSRLVEIGRYFVHLSDQVNAHLPREVWLDALSVNRSEWDTDDMRKYGDSPMNVVAVLNLENSATKDDDILTRPLTWCCQMALMNAMKTSSTLAKVAHEAINEEFGGVFGEFRERSPLERMGIPASMLRGVEG